VQGLEFKSQYWREGERERERENSILFTWLLQSEHVCPSKIHRLKPDLQDAGIKRLHLGGFILMKWLEEAC
jgi:hypothetical protein